MGQPTDTQRTPNGHPTDTNKNVENVKKEENEKKERARSANAEPARPEYSEAFLRWWELYPRKTGKRKAEEKWQLAVKRIKAARGLDLYQAREALCHITEVFAASPKGIGGFCPYPATWLHGGCYDDDPREWEERDKGTAVFDIRHGRDR